MPAAPLVPSVPAEPDRDPPQGRDRPTRSSAACRRSTRRARRRRSRRCSPVSQDVLAKGITIRAHKPTNSIFIRHYEADLERIKKLIREQLDVPLPQVKIEARMEILDRNALEAIGVQWGGAGAGNVGNTPRSIGQGFQTAPSTAGHDPPAAAACSSRRSRTARRVTGLRPNLEPDPGSLLPVVAAHRPADRRQPRQPARSRRLPNAATQSRPPAASPSASWARNFNINLALQALATPGQDAHARPAGDRDGREQQGRRSPSVKKFRTPPSARRAPRSSSRKPC